MSETPYILSDRIDSEFLFEARVKLDPQPLDIGATPEGHRVIYVVTGGVFEGPKLKGKILPNAAGADWVRARADGAFHLDVRFCLQTDDNALLYLHWTGRFHCAPEDFDYASDQAKPDDPEGASRYYFRSSPQFETSSEKYAWLNNIVCISKSRTGEGGVIHRIHEIK